MQMCGRRDQAEMAGGLRLQRGAWISLMPSLSDLAFLTPILVLFWCTTGVGWLLTDSATGWHIRAGEWMLKNARVPATDLFSFTKAGQPLFASEWLSAAVMSRVNSGIRFSAISLFSP